MAPKSLNLRDRIQALLEPIPVAADEDEFDPFAEQRDDPPPAEEGDDRVHASGE